VTNDRERVLKLDIRSGVFGTLLLLLAGLVAMVLFLRDHSHKRPAGLETVKLKLQWFPQAQFAGYLVAKEKGYFRDEGIDIEVRPAGPDIRPTQTVAQGADDLGIGVSNQVITATENGVDLVIVAQLFQDSANRYVLRAANRVTSLGELKGRNIGLWLGGDEAEFIAMLDSQKLPANFANIIAQGNNSVTQFLGGEFILTQATVYNELELIKNHVGGEANLQILNPAEYGAAIPGDMIFTTKRYLAKNPELVSKVVYASLRGWQYAFAHPNEAVEIVIRANPELKREAQLRQLEAVKQLVLTGKALSSGIGVMDADSYRTAQRVLLTSKQVKSERDPATFFADAPWKTASDRLKQLKSE